MQLQGRRFCVTLNWETNKDNDLYLQFISQVRVYGEGTLVALY